jgi:hypothetical protein
VEPALVGLKQVVGSPPSKPEVVLRVLSQLKVPVPEMTIGALQSSPACAVAEDTSIGLAESKRAIWRRGFMRLCRLVFLSGVECG